MQTLSDIFHLCDRDFLRYSQSQLNAITLSFCHRNSLSVSVDTTTSSFSTYVMLAVLGISEEKPLLNDFLDQYSELDQETRKSFKRDCELVYSNLLDSFLELEATK